MVDEPKRKRAYRKRVEWETEAYNFRLTTHPDEADEKQRLDAWLTEQRATGLSRSAALADIIVGLIRAYQGEDAPAKMPVEALINRRFDRLEKMIKDGQRDLLDRLTSNPGAAKQVLDAAERGERLDSDFLNNILDDFAR